MALERKAAEESFVLLKNYKELLPIDPKKKVSVVGELADKREEVVGAWSISWKEKDCVSVLDGIKERF